MASKKNKPLKVAKALKAYGRDQGRHYLESPNVTSVGIGVKKRRGADREACLQFTVGKKVAPESEALEPIGTKLLPKAIEVDGVTYPTDVIERNYEFDARRVNLEAKIQQASDRKSAVDPMIPRVSIGHFSISAGTAGCVVYNSETGEELLLSNWDVLQDEDGRLGDDVIQLGLHDDNRVQQNVVGQLVRSHLGLAGDCAVARINDRGLQTQILDPNGVKIDETGEPELGDKVVKSDRTTAATEGGSHFTLFDRERCDDIS